MIFLQSLAKIMELAHLYDDHFDVYLFIYLSVNKLIADK